MRSVVVTGMGAVTPIGMSVSQMWSSMVQGRSGVGLIDRFDTSGFSVRIAAQVGPEFDPGAFMDRRDAKRMDRFTQYAVAAARQAMDDAGLVASTGGQGAGPSPRASRGLHQRRLGGLETLEEQHSSCWGAVLTGQVRTSYR